MNIIELFDKLELGRDALAGFTANDVIRVEKQLNVEKRINPEIDANTAGHLVQAIRDFRASLVFVLSHRHLYNFFTGKDMPKRHFPEYLPDVDERSVREFISRFLSDDLELRLGQALGAEKFASIRELMQAREFIPEESLHRLEKRLTAKFEFALAQLNNHEFNSSGIGYLREANFYELLSGFSSIEMDDKVRILINLTSDMYNANKERRFVSDIMIALPNYKAFDEELNRVMRDNRGVVSMPTTTSSGFSGLSGRTILIIIVIVVKLVLVLGRCANDSSNSNNYDYTPDQNSDNLRIIEDYRIRSDNAKVKYFLDGLAIFERDSVRNIKPAKFKTGQNPFLDHFADSITKGPGNKKVTIANESPYDLVLLEFYGGTPSWAYFIQSGEKLKLTVDNRNYGFYFGNKLSSFDLGKDHDKESSSASKYRFLQPAPYCREKLDKRLRLVNDAVITKTGGQLRIKSERLEAVTDTLTGQGDYLF